MIQNVYESLIMLDTSKIAGDLQAVQQQLHAIMERNHAEVLASRTWDERRLAYPIRGQKKALYYLLYFKAAGDKLTGIEHDFKLNESILRFMVLRIEEKLQETMLALANDPHAMALQAVVEEPDDYSSMGGGGRDRDRGERRSPPVGAGAGDKH